MRFVILRHTRQGFEKHFDLMFEISKDSNELTTYSLFEHPKMLSEKTLQCKKIFDHSKKFLSYQGSVNQGQGLVERIDEGEVEIISLEPLKAVFDGIIIKGCFQFEKAGDDLFNIVSAQI